jgi:hypothetical protein
MFTNNLCHLLVVTLIVREESTNQLMDQEENVTQTSTNVVVQTQNVRIPIYVIVIIVRQTQTLEGLILQQIYPFVKSIKKEQKRIKKYLVRILVKMLKKYKRWI